MLFHLTFKFSVTLGLLNLVSMLLSYSCHLIFLFSQSSNCISLFPRFSIFFCIPRRRWAPRQRAAVVYDPNSALPLFHISLYIALSKFLLSFLLTLTLYSPSQHSLLSHSFPRFFLTSLHLLHPLLTSISLLWPPWTFLASYSPPSRLHFQSSSSPHLSGLTPLPPPIFDRFIFRRIFSKTKDESLVWSSS